MPATVEDLHHLLISKGGFLLGDPYVELRPAYNEIGFSIFFTYSQHGVHFVLFESKFFYTLTPPLYTFTTNPTNTTSNVPNSPPPKIVSYETFVEKYSNATVNETDYIAFQNQPSWDISDKLKRYGGIKVLASEHSILFRQQLHTVLYNFSELMLRTGDTKVEHCVYLAKLDGGSGRVDDDCFQIPLDWLVELFPVDSKKYSKLSLPYNNGEKFYAARKIVPIAM